MEKIWTVLQDYAFALVDANDTAMEILGVRTEWPEGDSNVELSERLGKNKFNFKTKWRFVKLSSIYKMYSIYYWYVLFKLDTTKGPLWEVIKDFDQVN